MSYISRWCLLGIRDFAIIQFRSDLVFGTFFFIHPVLSGIAEGENDFRNTKDFIHR